jgi:hypothetical protein
MRKKLALGVMVAAVTGFMPMSALAADPVTLEVYDPTGGFEITKLNAPRLPDLNGKTICEISNDTWETRRTFPLIRELLQKKFPTAKIIPYTEVVATRAQCENLDYVAKMVKQKGCQAVISGNAG